MSDPTFPGAQPTKARPSIVTLSSYLLFLVAGIMILNAVLGLGMTGTITDVYREAYEGTEVAGTEGLMVATSVGSAVVGLLFAAGLVVLALLNNRGKNPSRIVTWVVGGINLCCSGLTLLGTAAASSITMPSQGNMPDQAEVQRRLEEALPNWFTPVTIVLSVVVLLATLAALILLALPASNEYFRKPQAGGWEPPVPGFPAYPAYPQAGTAGAGMAPPVPPAGPPPGQTPTAGPGAGPPPVGPGQVPPAGGPGQPGGAPTGTADDGRPDGPAEPPRT